MILKDIYFVLKELDLKKIVFFGLLNVVVLILELLSFTMFIPFLLALTSKDRLLENNYFLDFLNFFEINQNDGSAILFLLFVLLVIVFFIKNLFIGISKFFQYKISYNIELSLTSLVFQKYLRRPYLIHTAENSSKALRNILGETTMFARAMLISILNLVIESIVLVGILVILFLNQPEVTLKLLISFAILGFSLFIIFKKKIFLLGQERQTQENSRLKYAQQGIQGIKEIIAFNLQEFISKLYYNSTAKVIKNGHFASFINQLPRLILEFSAIIIILVIFYTTDEIKNDLNQQIYLLGLVAATAFRLFPAINKIILSLNTFQYSKPSVNILTKIFKEDIKNLKIQNLQLKQSSKEITINNAIEIKGLNYKYPSTENPIFNDLNLFIKKGEHIGVMGNTGSGKSTLVNLLLGIFDPTEGTILCDNVKISNNLPQWRNLIGYVSQFPYLLDDTIKANVALGVEYNKISEKQVYECLEKADLKNFVLELNDGINTIVGERGAQLSGGEIQRLAIARAYYKNPKILLLDEATSSVDKVTQAKIIENFSKFKDNSTMISISHDKDALIYCDKIYLLKDNNLILLKS